MNADSNNWIEEQAQIKLLTVNDLKGQQHFKLRNNVVGIKINSFIP